MLNHKTIVEFKKSYSYSLAFSRQIELSSMVRTNEIAYAVMGLEHSPVITLGRRANKLLDLQIDEKTIKGLGYEVVQSERGGQATLHHPGQLVIYPILPLKNFNLGIRAYVDLLLVVTKDLLSSYGIHTMLGSERPGLYTASGKIVFIGIRVENGISRHGIAINVSNDLSEFHLIASCGVIDSKLDKVSHYVNIDTKTLFLQWQDFLRIRLEALLTSV
ncbi:MAG: lipoyl(octanoyl) transferase LipB [Bdellovibrionales bacterium]|nr:lipoyl(octanoyl) transferase LipB [Bdellovibrionales bacterium]